MADNRQFADHVELGGANVYFKEEPTTGTTMPSTSYFKTEDVDGKPVKISRDNIMGIVKECLGTILNGGSDQTTVTKVPTLNGNTLGASAVGTLASVLGVRSYKQIPMPGLSNEDLNGFKENQCRIYGGGVNPVNAPTNNGVRFLIVNQTGYGFVLQKLVSHSGTSAAEYVRYWDGGSWSSWGQI